FDSSESGKPCAAVGTSFARSRPWCGSSRHAPRDEPEFIREAREARRAHHAERDGYLRESEEPMPVRLAAVADVHCGKQCPADLQPLLARAAESADVLALCGDLTDYGLPEEAEALAKGLATVKIPMVGVLGNHDFESGRHDEVKKILGEAGLKILDGE